MKSKLMLIMVFAIFICTVSATCAADANETTIATQEDNQMELTLTEDEIRTNENDNMLTQTEDAEILTSGEGSYSDLRNDINSGGNLTKSHYRYHAGDGDTIVIKTSGVINGNGAVIDMNGSNIRTFEVSASGVTIKNLTIINANYNGNGGAIYFTSSGTVSNCNFTNNKATGTDSWGGAVYFNREGTVTNCNFTNNSARHGGAIHIGAGSVSNCNFADNTAAAGWGGAVYFSNTGTVTNCNFTNNTATFQGGAIRFWSTATVTNCNFTGNTAGSDGGAINIGSGSVSNCNFTNNNATRDGGAVYFSSTGNVTNCNFTNNNATRDGGAVYFYQGTGTVTNCNFTNNNATKDGGAIYFVENSDGSVINCNFTDNIATSQGGAVYFENSGNVTNCNFTGNTATSQGGAVYFENSGNVTNCNFTDNSADYGGAIRYLNGEGNVKNCNFVSNTAFRWGGAIRFNVDSTVTNCNFTGNTASRDGGAINMGGGTVSNCNFINNTATENGGAVRMTSGNVSNCNFTDNSAGYGGAIYFYYSSINAVTKCNFIGNNATEGSAIYFYSASSKTVSNSRFLNNRANAEELQVTKNENNITIIFKGHNNLLNAIYSRNDTEVTFINVTYWGAKGINNTGSSEIKPSRSKNESGQNITVGIVVNGILVLNEVKVTDENGMIVLPIKIESENYYIGARHDKDSYYTEAEKTISNNMKFSVNVTSQTANNRTVNITAKSDIYGNFMSGKLLFILPDGTADGMVIEANYSGNGAWWAKYTFADYGDYKVNATYVGLDNVTITNATISISKTPTEITIINETVELLVGDSVVTGATLTPAYAGELTFTSSNITVAKVEDGKIIAVGEGSAIITVSFAGNDDYAAAEDKTINVDVIKYDSKVTIEPINSTVYPNNVTIKYSIENKTNVTVTIDGVSDDKIIITNDTITVIGLDAGEYTITILNNESSIYHKSNDTKAFTVNKQATSITASDVTTTYNINKDLVITLKDSNGKALANVKVTVDLNGAKTYTTDKNGQIKVSTKGIAPKTYTARITFNGNTNYEKSAKNVKVTVKKATPKLTAKKKTFKTSVKTKKYTITLKDNTGKAIKKAKVTLKVKGKTYKATTNSKGKAVFKIKNLKKKGTFKATITYKGNKYYNKVSKKANIKVIVTFKTVSKGNKDKSTVKEIQQALKDHGYYLSYKGHYLKVDGKFQSCTERSVKEFQKDKGLKVTGKVDEKTAKKLGII